MVKEIVLYGSLSPAQLVVMLFTWSKYGHAGFVYEDGALLDAHPLHGVSKRRWRLPKLAWEKRYPVDPAMADAYHRRARRQLGKPYDWLWIVAYPFNRRWQDDGSWVCFELVAWTLGIDRKLHRITGRQLERILDARNGEDSK